MKKLIYVLVLFTTVFCTVPADKKDVSTRDDASPEDASFATIKMQITEQQAKLYYGTDLPEFEVSLHGYSYKSQEGFKRTDSRYEASVRFPYREKGLETLSVSLIDKSKISIVMDNVPIDPCEPTVLDFELFLCDMGFNITIDSDYDNYK